MRKGEGWGGGPHQDREGAQTEAAGRHLEDHDRQSHKTIRELTVSANYWTPLGQENDKNQHWMCLCWGNFCGTPLAFLLSTFLFLSLFHFPHRSLFSPPSITPSLLSLFSYCTCCTAYALCSCKRTIILTASLLCGAHGKDNYYGPIFSMELCK